MSVGGSQMLMSRVGPNLYRPFASETFSELRGPGPNESGPDGEWVLIDSSGRQYLFEKIEALDDPTLWLLTRITDSVGNKLTLHYQVGTSSDDVEQKEVNLIEVAHSYLAGTDGCPKYRVFLSYGSAEADEPVLGYRLDHGKVQVRRRLLERISVRANTNACEGFGEVLRTYHFSYSPDVDSGRLRLERVDLSGRGGAGTLPVATYTYGSAKTAGDSGFDYELARTVPYPASTIGHMSASEEQLDCTSPLCQPSVQWKFQTISAWVDFTGDGRPDFVRPASYGANPGLLTHYVNGPNGNLVGTSVGLGGLANLAEQTRRELTDWAEGRVKSAAIESWREIIDWNGDGRMDIVQARGAIDNDHWLVLLSFPSSPGFGNSPVSWVPRQVNIYALREALKERGYQDIRDDEPLPLSRSQTVGHYYEEQCIKVLDNGQVTECQPQCFYDPYETPPQTCHPGPPPYYNLPSQTVTEWKLQDSNGDGFADFLLNSNPISETREDKGGDWDRFCLESTTLGLVHLNRDCWNFSWKTSQHWTYDTAAENELLIYYNNNGAGLANPALAAEFTIPVTPNVLVDAGVCGVERWGVSDESNHLVDVLDREMICGFREINGDGLIDRVTSKWSASLNTGAAFGSRNPFITLPDSIRAADYRKTICGDGHDNSSNPYPIRTEGELVDLTSDGIPDFATLSRIPSQGWKVHVGTGVDFAPPRPVAGEFEISLVQETCKQEHYITRVGLVDFDGDGSPDVVRGGAGNTLEIRTLRGGGGALSAGRLTVVRNGYGGATKISYANAKADGKTDHQVPFPEIVVAETKDDDEKDHTKSFDPVYFAFGDARLQYNPILARWTFPGYGRRVTVRGIASPEPGKVTGTAIVERYLQPEELPQGLQRYALAGRLKSQQLFVGTFGDAWSVDDLLLITERWQGALDVKQAVLDTNEDGEGNAVDGDECGDIDPVTFQPSSPMLCRSTAVVYLGETRSWRGKSPPPSTEAVEVLTSVLKVDEFGRPIVIRNEHDTARDDDNTCVTIEYAAPVNTGLLGVLDALSSVHTTECTKGFAFSGQRYQYDNLAEGKVSRGLLTNIVLERYDASTGSTLPEIDALHASHDTYGNVERLFSARSDGVSRTTTFQYDPFGLAISTVTSSASDISLASTIVYSMDPRFLLPQFVEDSNGVIVSLKYDEFGRGTRATLIDPADDREYMLEESVYFGDDPIEDPLGRRVSHRSFDTWMLASAYMGPTKGVRETTTYFDSFGRADRSEIALGIDYEKTLTDGDRLYDGLGRIRFLADTYVNGETPQYGTTYLYEPDGSLSCVVRGIGYQTSTTPEVATDLYPTCFTYGFSDRQSVLQVRGPNELGEIGPQAGAFDEQRSSAIGWPLSHARFNASGERIQYAAYDHDHLGQLTQIERFKDPAGASPAATAWSFAHDSLGQTLSIQEPGSSAVTTVYDDWGSPIATTWVDSTASPAVVRGTRNVYDGFGRLKHQETTLNGETDPEFSRYDYFYDVASGDPAQLGATYLRGQLAWVSDKRGDDTDQLLTYFGYDSLGRANLTVHQDTAENQSFVQQQVASPLGEPLEITLRLPDSSSDELISYDLDSAGRIETITWKDSIVSSPVFDAEAIDPLGRYGSIRLGNGVSEKYEYRPDRRRELRSIVVEGPNFRRERTYAGYDGAGRERGRQERCVELPTCTGLFQKTAFSYDALNRLARAETSAGPATLADQSFSYDALGNLTGITDFVLPANSRVQVPSTDDADRLCRTEHPDAPGTGCSFSYDSLGNVLQAPDSTGVVRNFGYDAASRLVRMSKGNVTANLRYGAFGEVSQVDQTGPAEDFRRDRHYGPLVTASRFGSTDLIERRIPGPMGTVALRRGSGPGAVTLYVHADPNANRSFSGTNGEETQAVDYRPFGVVVNNTGEEDEPTFVRELWNGGDLFAAFGVARLGARFYDADLGRFLQRDPLMSTSTSSRANPYSFAFNDPVNFIDPSGLQPEGGPTGNPPFEGSIFSEWVISVLGSGGSSQAELDRIRNEPALWQQYRLDPGPKVTFPPSRAWIETDRMWLDDDHYIRQYEPLYEQAQPQDDGIALFDGPTFQAFRGAAPRLGATVDRPFSTPNTTGGIVYISYDSVSGRYYTGRASSLSHALQRWRTEIRDNPNKRLEFYVREAGLPGGRGTWVREEVHIRRNGGPWVMGGELLNGRYEGSEARYREFGGTELRPTPNRLLKERIRDVTNRMLHPRRPPRAPRTPRRR